MTPTFLYRILNPFLCSFFDLSSCFSSSFPKLLYLMLTILLLHPYFSFSSFTLLLSTIFHFFLRWVLFFLTQSPPPRISMFWLLHYSHIGLLLTHNPDEQANTNTGDSSVIQLCVCVCLTHKPAFLWRALCSHFWSCSSLCWSQHQPVVWSAPYFLPYVGQA